MIDAIFIGGLLVGLGATLAAIGAVGNARWLAALFNRLAAEPVPVDAARALPDRLRDFALRAGASPGDLARCVRFSQSVEMQLQPGGRWQPMEAEQTLTTGAPGFVWQAQQKLGPLTRFRVVDAFVGAAGELRVRLFGLIRIANTSGPELHYAQALRYLAELPWVPDAILGNPALRWRDLDNDWVEVTMDVDGVAASVKFRFDSAGDIALAVAEARLTTDHKGDPVDYPWHCHYRDYRMVGPRRIPTEGEAGYIRPEGYRAYFQGRITAYEAMH